MGRRLGQGLRFDVSFEATLPRNGDLVDVPCALCEVRTTPPQPHKGDKPRKFFELTQGVVRGIAPPAGNHRPLDRADRTQLGAVTLLPSSRDTVERPAAMAEFERTIEAKVMEECILGVRPDELTDSTPRINGGILDPLSKPKLVGISRRAVQYRARRACSERRQTAPGHRRRARGGWGLAVSGVKRVSLFHSGSPKRAKVEDWCGALGSCIAEPFRQFHPSWRPTGLMLGRGS